MALYERAQSGKGQTVNANMIEGTAFICSVLWCLQSMKNFNQTTWDGVHDGGAPFFQTYQTSDGKFMAVAALEAHIYELFLKGLDPSELPKQLHLPDWPRLKTLCRSICPEDASRTVCDLCRTRCLHDPCSDIG